MSASIKSPRRLRHLATVMLGVAISAVLLWAALRKVSYDQIVAAFEGADWWWLIPALGIMFVSVWLRAVRWRRMFDDPARITPAISFAAINVGFLFNNLLPQRTGDIARLVAVNRANGTPRTEVAATIIAERITDLFTLGTIGLLSWPWFPKTDWVLVVELVCVGAVAGPLLLVTLLAGFRRHVPKIVSRGLARVPFLGDIRAGQMTGSLAAGMRILLRPRRLAPVMLLSFTAWLLMGVSGLATLQMFDFQLDEVPAMLLALVAVNFAVVIPSSPGAVGVFEAATQASLVAFGLTASQALSFAVVSHALAFFPFVLSGLIGVWTVKRLAHAKHLHLREAVEESHLRAEVA